MILLVSHADDPQGDAVARRLAAAGEPFDRVQPARLSVDALYAIEPVSGCFGSGQVFSSFQSPSGVSTVSGQPWSAIYWRRPLPVGDRLSVTFPAVDEIAKAEAYHAFRLAIESLPDRLFPLGHPVAMERASNKLLQLRVARDTGFRVPDTLVGNDPAALDAFLARHDRVVVKPLHAHGAYRREDRSRIEQMLWCRGVDPGALRARLNPGRPSQLMIQEQVIKKEDWRITVLPHLTVCCRIDTSNLAAENPDWRKSPKKFPHTIFEPPAEFDTLLRDYLAALGLKAGYFDFAVAQDGTPWFLEVNTNAEWLWI